MLRSRRRNRGGLAGRDGSDDDLSYLGVMDEIEHEKRRSRTRPRSRATTLLSKPRPEPTWKGLVLLAVIFLGGMALLVGASFDEAHERSQVDQMEAATRCATVPPAASSNVLSTNGTCAVWLTAQVFGLDIPDKGTTDLTLEDATGGDWDLYYDNPSGLVRGLKFGQSVKMLVWQGDAVAVGLSTTGYALDNDSPQDEAALDLGMIILSGGMALMAATGLYSNIDRRRHPEDRRRRIGVTPLALINICVGFPCLVGGLVVLGAAPNSFGALIFLACFAFLLWCLFGWLFVRQRIRRIAGLLA
jgi:hypothetical protein